jgi:hypothetical protein
LAVFVPLCAIGAFGGKSVNWGSDQIVPIFTGIFSGLAIICLSVLVASPQPASGLHRTPTAFAFHAYGALSAIETQVKV